MILICRKVMYVYRKMVNLSYNRCERILEIGIFLLLVFDLSGCATAITCDGILSPTGGTSNCTSDGNAHGSKCIVTCDEGYSLSGTSVRTCENGDGTNGTWSGTHVICSAITCSPYVFLNNGYSSCNTAQQTYGSSCIISCNTGFYMARGSSPITCGNGVGTVGQWSDTTHVCKQIKCPQISQPAGGNKGCPETNYNGQCTINCVTGYYQTSGTTTRTCGNGNGIVGMWSGHAVVCKSIKCAAYEHPTNGNSNCSGTAQKPYGTVCTVSCNVGFYMTTGSSSITCGNGDGTVGQWSDTTHKCEPIKCAAYEHPTNGNSNCSGTAQKPYGTVCTVSCNIGFFMTTGSSAITCGNGVGTVGQWSDTTHVCRQIKCPQISQPAGGNKGCPETNYNGYCTINCVTGYYQTSGTATRTCGNGNGVDGMWSGHAVVCERITCPSIPQPPHATNSCSESNYGDTCTITCNERYFLIGTSTRICTSNVGTNGKWSGADVHCTAIKCTPYEHPTNGNSNCSGTAQKPYGTVCTVSCNVGFYMTTGSSSITCGNGAGTVGHWSDTTHICEQITCSAISQPAGGDKGCPETNYNGKCTINCVTGYHQTSGTTTRTCGNGNGIDGVWSGQAVVCETGEPSDGNSNATIIALSSTVAVLVIILLLVGISWGVRSRRMQSSTSKPQKAKQNNTESIYLTPIPASNTVHSAYETYNDGDREISPHYEDVNIVNKEKSQHYENIVNENYENVIPIQNKK